MLLYSICHRADSERLPALQRHLALVLGPDCDTLRFPYEIEWLDRRNLEDEVVESRDESRYSDTVA